MYNKQTGLNNKLFLTFTTKEDIDNIVEYTKSVYTILYNKIFVLQIKDSEEFAITYNIEIGNINNIPSNTISVHRNKEYNVLYSLNSLNSLVKELNGGRIDKNFIIDWSKYKNSILVTQNGNFKQLKTNIFNIINI